MSKIGPGTGWPGVLPGDLQQAQVRAIGFLAHELRVERDEIAGREASERVEQINGGGDWRRG